MTKRANGEGSVRQRPNGSWEGRVSYIDPATERRRSVSVYAATAKDCRAKLKAVLERLEDGRPAQDAKMTVGSWVKVWRETSLPASPRKPSTRELYSLLAKKHLEQGPIAAVTLDKLKPTHVEALLVRLHDNGLGDTSVRNVYGVLRAALDVAVRDDLLAVNPAAKVKRPAVEKREAAYLPTTDVSRLIGELDGLRYALAIVVLAATGMRRGEAAALRWSDVDLTKGTVTVSGTISRLEGKLVRTPPKTSRSRRTIPIPPSVVAGLKKHRTAQAAERLKAGDLWEDTGAVFATEAGGWIGPDNLGRTVTIAAKRAGMEGVTAHTLRHSAATAWLEGGTHIRAVADLLGHSSISVTGDIYTHATSERQQAAVDNLASQLGL